LRAGRNHAHYPSPGPYNNEEETIMKAAAIRTVLALLLAGSLGTLADDDDRDGNGHLDRLNASFSTLITTPLVIEGLTNDDRGNLYAPGRTPGAGVACPVWRTGIASPSLTVVGLIPAPSATANCSPSGLAFGRDGQLYVTENDKVYRFTPDAASPPTATLFATGIPGTNGLAFDRAGNLWTGDGTTGAGRVWRISPAGVATEMFRIPPTANEVNLVGGIGGVGRDPRTLPPGAITVTPTSRNAQNTAGSQPLVANGLAFTRRGDLLIADTARGAYWLVRVDRDGNPSARTGCDTTYAPNTLCMSHVWIAHPLLEGTDGIAVDREGNVWTSANERNAIVAVTGSGEVVEIFRNAPDTVTRLRNTGPLESPASPVVAGHRVCTSNSDGNRRDNSPSSAGEIGGAVGQPRGKISCMDQEVHAPGLDLPVR
jgi:sugar lactone lactonase YvrE